jgi:hypothetical protein
MKSEKNMSPKIQGVKMSIIERPDGVVFEQNTAVVPVDFSQLLYVLLPYTYMY